MDNELKTIDQWHESDGSVLWWKFPIVEPPYVGEPDSEDWPGYHTHWQKIEPPPEPPMPDLSPEESMLLLLKRISVDGTRGKFRTWFPHRWQYTSGDPAITGRIVNGYPIVSHMAAIELKNKVWF